MNYKRMIFYIAVPVALTMVPYSIKLKDGKQHMLERRMQAPINTRSIDELIMNLTPEQRKQLTEDILSGRNPNLQAIVDKYLKAAHEKDK
jgi:hypothetical protein